MAASDITIGGSATTGGRPAQGRRAGRAAVGLAVAAAAGLLSGCLSIAEPKEDMASQHVRRPQAFAAATADAVGDIADGWLAEFDSELLEALVAEALLRNPDLFVAAGRMEEATARLGVARSLLLPQLSAVGSAGRRDDGGAAGPVNAYSVGLEVSWEIDLWGRLRASREAAARVAEAAGFEFIAARHSLAAAVVEAYYAVTTARMQLQIDERLLEAEAFTATTIRQRVEAGVATPLEVDLASANVALAEAAIQEDRRAWHEARRALEVLLGRYPTAEVEATETLPPVPGPVAVGVPSQLLERRPDILAAQRQVQAAFYNVEQAKAARLPRLTLVAAGGTLLDPEELFWSIAAQMLAPLYTGGQLESQVRIADAVQRQTLGLYVATALDAFNEVETALANQQFLARQEAQLATASERMIKASRVAENRYENGLLTILELQQVRRQDFQTRTQLLRVRFERLRQQINLYLALGGPVEVLPPDRQIALPELHAASPAPAENDDAQ